MIGRIRDALARLREAIADRPLEIEWPETDELAAAPLARPPAAAADPDTEPVWEQRLLTRALAEDVDTFRVGYRADDADTWERLRRGDELLDQVAADLAAARGRRTVPSRKAVSGG
ncbi:hypothetical protein ACFYOK_29530 [Microbispora bryophytorum]|uniref:hypothetical protein n=1 Tax=Microbispora bryophytorum TaxID=1460882 RepID=UPI00340073F3